MQEKAAERGAEATLMGKQGQWMRNISAAINTEVYLPILRQTQPVKFIDPFVHIAGQVNKGAFDRVPFFNLLRTEFRNDMLLSCRTQ
jgi:hypothetical protein